MPRRMVTVDPKGFAEEVDNGKAVATYMLGTLLMCGALLAKSQHGHDHFCFRFSVKLIFRSHTRRLAIVIDRDGTTRCKRHAHLEQVFASIWSSVKQNASRNKQLGV